MKRKVVLIIGLGWQQETGIRLCLQKNFYIIGLDHDPNPFCLKLVDKFISCNTQDIPKCLHLIKKIRKKIDHIITFNSEANLITASLLRKKLDIFGLKYSNVNNLINKYKLKKLLIKSKLPFSDYKIINKNFKFNNLRLNFPLIIKPISSSGSRGVFLCKNILQLKNNIVKTKLFCGNDNFIIEKYIKGREFSIESIIYKKIHYILLFSKRIKKNNVSASEIYTVKLNKKLIDKINKYFQKLISNLSIDNCALHSEIIIDKKEDIYLIDCSPRGGGFMVCDGLVPKSTNYNLTNAIIEMEAGNSLAIPNIQKINYSSIKYLSSKPGILKKINYNKKNNNNISFRFFNKKGDIIKKYENDGHRVGYVLSSSDSIKEARHLSNTFCKNVKIILK